MAIFTLETIKKIQEGFRKKYGHKDPEDNGVLLYQEEVLDEVVVYKDMVTKSRGYCIFSDVQDTRPFDKDPYIKVYNNVNKDKATKLCRVSMKTGTDIDTDHTNIGKDAGKENIKLTKEMAEFLNNAMDKPHCAKGLPATVVTVYDTIYYYIADKFPNYTKYDKPVFKEKKKSVIQ